MNEPQWLAWGKSLQAIAQNGLSHASNPFDIERYRQLQRVAAAIIAEHTNVAPEYVEQLFAQEVGYATPKVGVRAAVFRESVGMPEILLVQESGSQKWCLPGGWADAGETASRAAEREVWEETGFRVEAVRLVAVYDYQAQGHQPPLPFSLYRLYFLCRLIGGTARPSIETTAVQFFAQDSLPLLDEKKLLPRQLQRMFAYYENEELPADFD